MHTWLRGEDTGVILYFWCHLLLLLSVLSCCARMQHQVEANNTCRHRHNTHVIPRESAQVCAGCVSLCLCLRRARTYDMHNAQAFLFWSNYHTPRPHPHPPSFTHINCSSSDTVLMSEWSQLAREQSRSIVLI